MKKLLLILLCVPQFIIAQTTLTSIIIFVDSVECFGGSDGSAQVLASGGTPPYIYMWANGQMGPIVQNVSAGTYTCTITDANGATTTQQVTVNQPTLLTSSIVSIDSVGCFGGIDGSATVQASGGTPNYTYSWSNGQTGPTLQNVSVGTYSCTITDANGCSTTQQVTINEPFPLLCIMSFAYPTGGLSNGSIDLTISGGTSVYTFLWTGPGGPYTTEDLIGLAAGTYNVLITDFYGCTTTCSISLNTPTGMSHYTTSKKILKVVDILGRDMDQKTNKILFYIYNDGTVEKKIIIE